MAMRDDLHRLIDELPEQGLPKVLAFIRCVIGGKTAAPELDEESRTWLDAPLTPPLDEYDWGGVNPESIARPVEWDERRGAFVVVGGKDVPK